MNAGDQFRCSFNIVLFDLIRRNGRTYLVAAGKLPFKGESPENVIHAILNDEPPLPSEMNVEIPAKLDRIITRALAKSLQGRFQNISEIMVELQAPEISLQVTGQFEDLPNQTQPSIAVLAFEDMSPAKDQEYFCDGIAEEIINILAQVSGMRVAARTSSFAYKGKREDIRNIGGKLGVRSVLEGSVRKTDSRLRITTQLIDVADGHHLWTDQYDPELEDVFAIQEEITHNIARALKIKLSKREKNAMEWVKRLAVAERDEPHFLYGIACLYSLIGKAEEAVFYLAGSLEFGFAHRQYLEKDSDFDPIREHPSYKAFIKYLKAREKASGST